MLLTAAPKPVYVYVGTYTNKGSKGIYAYRFEASTGKLDSIGLVAETPNPTFLAIHPSGKYLYAANEIGNYKGERAGSVSAFKIEAGGKLTPLNTVSSKGSGPAHLTVDRAGSAVLVANYGGGSVAVLPIAGDGSLKEASSFIQHTGSSVNRGRQREPHAHSVNVSRDNRFAVVADLGIDKLMIYRFQASTGALTPNDPPFTATKPGSGPRHFTFHPKLQTAYAINELASTVAAYDWDPRKGTLTEKQNLSTLPADYKGEGNSTAEVVVHPNGKFLYGSNRGHDSVAIFSIGPKGMLTMVDVTPVGVKVPRNFAIDPSGQYLFAEGQNSNDINLFKIDTKTGRLTATGTKVEVGAPVCVRFVAAK
jgi:6-phosphogluconolactonase